MELGLLYGLISGINFNMPLQIGRLDRTIKIIKRSSTKNLMGEPSLIESVRHEALPCRVVPVKASERFNHHRDMATKINNFRVRFISDIEATDLVEYEGEKYDIRGIIPGGTRQREWLDILGEAFETVGV